jgi:dUTP pyrophosphatase
MNQYPVRIELLDEKCKPHKEHDTDAGWDLRSANPDFTLYKEAKVKVATGIKLAIPKGQAGLIIPRSGLGSKYRIELANTVGCIDSDYRGEVFVFLTNNGNEDIEIKQYDRFAQLIVVPVNISKLRYVSSLPGTKRDAGGFGHTGVE